MNNKPERLGVEGLAKKFHEEYERLAPEFGYKTRKESAVPWDEVPEHNRALMRKVCAVVMLPQIHEAEAALRKEMDQQDKEAARKEVLMLRVISHERAQAKKMVKKARREVLEEACEVAIYAARTAEFVSVEDAIEEAIRGLMG